jgi:hypothetical protein
VLSKIGVSVASLSPSDAGATIKPRSRNQCSTASLSSLRSYRAMAGGMISTRRSFRELENLNLKTAADGGSLVILSTRRCSSAANMSDASRISLSLYFPPSIAGIQLGSIPARFAAETIMIRFAGPSRESVWRTSGAAVPWIIQVDSPVRIVLATIQPGNACLLLAGLFGDC